MISCAVVQWLTRFELTQKVAQCPWNSLACCIIRHGNANRKSYMMYVIVTVPLPVTLNDP